MRQARSTPGTGVRAGTPVAERRPSLMSTHCGGGGPQVLPRCGAPERLGKRQFRLPDEYRRWEFLRHVGDNQQQFKPESSQRTTKFQLGFYRRPAEVIARDYVRPAYYREKQERSAKNATFRQRQLVEHDKVGPGSDWPPAAEPGGHGVRCRFTHACARSATGSTLSPAGTTPRTWLCRATGASACRPPRAGPGVGRGRWNCAAPPTASTRACIGRPATARHCPLLTLPAGAARQGGAAPRPPRRRAAQGGLCDNSPHVVGDRVWAGGHSLQRGAGRAVCARLRPSRATAL